MTATIFLHIGMDKTGTTAIQSFFNKQRDALKQQGLLYPVTGCNGIAHYGLSNALGFFHGKKNENNVSDLLNLAEQLADEIETSELNTILFSSEFFMIPKPVQPVRAFFSSYDIKIVIYLRRHDSWWESVYNQAVKTVASPPWGRGFEHYFEFQKKRDSKRGNYRNVIDTWANVFGKENIIIRPYEQQQNQPNIIADILEAIDFSSVTQQLDAVSKRSNESLSYLALNLIDIYQRANISSDIRAHLIQQAIPLGDKNISASIIPPGLRRQLVDQNMPDYEYIAREYLGREDGRLFYDPLPDPKRPWSPPAHPSWANVVEHTVKAMADLGKKI